MLCVRKILCVCVLFHSCLSCAANPNPKRTVNNFEENLVFNNQEESIFYSKEKISRSIALGFSPKASLSEKNGNIYFTLKFCNFGKYKITFKEDEFDRNVLLGYKVEFSLGGRELLGKYLEGNFISEQLDPKKITIKKNQCHERNYNLNDFFRVYNIKGEYSIFYRDKLGLVYVDNKGVKKADWFFVQSNTATLLVK